MKRRILPLALAASVVAHIALFVWFEWHSGPDLRGRRGVVAVSYIQPVNHAASVPAKRPVSHAPAPKPEAPPQAETPPPPAPTEPAGDPAATARESSLFIGEVSRLVSQNKIYPRQAIEREEEGKVIVGLTLDRDGHLVDSRIEERCPFETLNDAALKTVRAVDHYPQVPAEVPAPIHLHIPLVFRIERG